MGTACLAFAPGGNDLAWVGGNENIIRFWDPSTGARDWPQPGHRGAIGDAVFAPDGRALVTVSEDRTLRFWDPIYWRRDAQDRGQRRTDLVRRPVGRRQDLATGGGLRPSRLWDAASGRMIREFSIAGEHFTWCGDLSADGKTLATSENNDVILWDTTTGQRRVGTGRPTSRRENHMVKALQLHPTGSRWPPSAATGSGFGTSFWQRRLDASHSPTKGPSTACYWMAPGSYSHRTARCSRRRAARRPNLSGRRRLGSRVGPNRWAIEQVQGPGVLA